MCDSVIEQYRLPASLRVEKLRVELDTAPGADWHLGSRICDPAA